MPHPEPPPDAVAAATFTSLTEEPVDDITGLSNGYGHLSWVVHTASGRYLLKSAVRNLGIVDLFRQVAAQQIAAAAGVDTPLVVAVSATGGPLGRPCYVQTWLDGIDAATILTSASLADRLQIGYALGEAVGGMHAVNGPRFADDCAATSSYASWRSACTARLRRVVDLNRDAAVLPPTVVETAADHLAMLIDRLPEGIPARLIHRDLHLPNVVVRPCSPRVALLDWEAAAFGDPIWDFVKLTMWVFDRHPTLKAPFLNGYTAVAGPLPGDFDQRLQTYQAIEYLAAFPYFGRRWPDGAMLDGFRKLLAAWMDTARLPGGRP